MIQVRKEQLISISDKSQKKNIAVILGVLGRQGNRGIMDVS